MQNIVTNDRHLKIVTEKLLRIWNIGFQTANDTLAATTQHDVRTAVRLMSRRL